MSIETLRPIRMEDYTVTRQESLLSNGAKVVLFEKPRAPISMRAMFSSGSRYDPLGLEGTSHFLEHMLVAGSERFPTKDMLATYIEQYGGSMGAATGSDSMYVSTTIPESDDITIGFDVLHEILMEPGLFPATLENERGAVLNELGDCQSSPNDMLSELYRKLYYQGTVTGRSILGSEETINALSRDDLLRFKEEMLTSGRMALVVSGGVSMERLVESAEAQLIVPYSDRPELPEPLPIVRDQPIMVEGFNNTDRVSLSLGFRVPPSSDSEHAALNIITEVLGGGRASSLNKKLRQNGLVYSVFAYKDVNIDSGTWDVTTSTTKENVQKVIDVIADETKRVTDHGLSAEEVSFAQKKMMKSFPFSLETAYQWLNWHAKLELTRSQPYTVEEYSEDILRVTPEDTMEVAQKYFGAGKEYLGMCGNISAEDVRVKL